MDKTELDVVVEVEFMCMAGAYKMRFEVGDTMD